MSLTKTSIKAGGFIGAHNLLDRIASLIKIGILARLLSPAQFGIFGIVSLSLGVLETFSDTGVSQYLIHKKTPLREDYSAAIAINFSRGLLIAAILYLLASPTAVLFNTPSATPFLRLIALAPLIRGLKNPSAILFQKHLRFKKEFILRSSKSLTELAVAVLVALSSPSVFALVAALIAGAFVEVTLSYILISPAKLIKPPLAIFRQHLKFSRWIWGSSLLSYFTVNGDDIVVGAVLGSHSLGLYQNAFKIASLPASQITSIISQVSFPAFSQIKSDKIRLKRAFLKTLALSLPIALFSSLILILLAKPLTLLILGQNWLSAVPSLQILAVYGAIKAATSNFGSLFIAIGKPHIMTFNNLVHSILLMALVIPMSLSFGLVGASVSAVIAILTARALLVLNLHQTLR